MKQLVTLCLVLPIVGCASKTIPISKPPQPVNGQCGIIQDVCILGDPSGTGDTTPPYGWMCLGRYGGTNDPCSVPTAQIEEGEIFAGENALEEKIKAAGPLRGLLTINDFTLEHPNCDPVYCHAHVMKRLVLDMGIPEENVRVTSSGDLSLIFSDEYGSEVRERTLVFNFPTSWAREVWVEEIDILERHSFLVVAALGNTKTAQNRRDLWYPDHPWWSSDRWERSMRALATGKLILAKNVEQRSDGTIVAYEDNVRCGLAKEFCYSTITPSEDLYLGTSGASSKLSALTFYLFQLWDTPREVVNVLNVCAEDIGEPGIDEEFGRGIVSVVCDTVQNREQGVVANSMNVFNASPVLTRMAGSNENRYLISQSLSATSRSLSVARWLKPFYAVRGHNLETITGHLGGQFFLKGTDFFVSSGADRTPLGIRSSLLHTTRTPFMEFGARRTLFSRRGYSIALLGAYGHSERDGLSAHVGHLGTRYEHRFNSAIFALYAGYQQVQGHLGIPGYREAGATPVFFMDGNTEVRFSFSRGW